MYVFVSMYVVLKISCKRFSLTIFFISCFKLHAQDFLQIFLVFFNFFFIFILNFDFKFPVQDGSKLGPFTLSPGHQRAGGNIFLCQQNLLFNLVFVHMATIAAYINPILGLSDQMYKLSIALSITKNVKLYFWFKVFILIYFFLKVSS